jgi:hypothetical protein
MRGLAREIKGALGNRLVCMCVDCQTYAHWLGRADELLDANGGTDVVQITPAQIELTEGTTHLRCIRQSPKGTLRWYASCCNTPIASTAASAKMPFVGMPAFLMDHAADGRSREQRLGPPQAWIHARWGKGELPAAAHPRAPVGLILRAVGQIFSAWVHGRHTPSPFFNATSGQPVVEPEIMTIAERQRLRALAGHARDPST